MPAESAAVLSIDRWGVLSVATFDAASDYNNVGISSVGIGTLVPGSPITVVSAGTTLWALMIDQAGCLSAASAELSSGILVWDGLARIGSPVFVPGTRVSVFEPSAGTLTALAVDRSGLLSACTLPAGLDVWQDLIGIGANTLMPGTAVVITTADSATFLALAIDRAGALNVARLSTGATPAWTGPESIGNSMFVPGGLLTVITDDPS
jgi:hypothetical protein